MPRNGWSGSVNLGRHAAECKICAHGQRDEIEQDFIAWRSPASITKQYGLRNRSTVYRHAHAVGLFPKRQRNVRAAVPVVYAQSSSSLDEIFDRLESDDPIVRRDARRDLGAQGQAAAPRIEKALQDAKASYRLQLGALVALNLMQNVTVSPETKASIAALYDKYRNSDPVLSSEAERYLHNLPAPTCGVRCGTERWMVKSFTDQDASKVNLTPQEATVSQLITLEAPPTLPTDRRVAPVEVQTYRVRALLMRYKEEPGDHDFHLTIADPHDVSQTMIVEIPDPQCSNVCATTQVRRISYAREAFANRFHPAFSFKGLDVPVPIQVTVTGIGFFDYQHHQSGRAPNGIELHPVLDIEVGQ